MLYRAVQNSQDKFWVRIKKKMYVVSGDSIQDVCAAAVCCSCGGAPTKEYTHKYPYSIMAHIRLTTAGIEVAPHYHQLLVIVPAQG